MKKILLLIATLFALQSQAQTSVKSTVKEINHIGAIYSQKVVVHNNITYIMSQNNGEYEFYNTSTKKSVKMLSGYTVHDFQILDANIYMCGTTGTEGFIAYSSIADLFSGTAIYSAYIQQSQTINKIQVYYDNNAKVRIAGIGKTSGGESVFISCIGSSTWSYNIYQSTVSTEIFDDIILKGNYIVTVGRGSNNRIPNVLVRTYEKNNIQQQTQSEILNAAGGWKYFQPLMADAIGGNSIAIVGKATDDAYNNGYAYDNFITAATFFDLTNSNGEAHILGSDTYVANYGEYKFIKSIKYSPADNKLLVLEEHPYQLNSLLSSVIVIDIARLTIANICYSSVNGADYKFNSLTEANPYTFIAAGVNSAGNQVAIWEGVRGALTGSCSFIKDIKEDIHQVLGTGFIPVTGNYTGTLNWTRDIKLDIGSISIISICN